MKMETIMSIRIDEDLKEDIIAYAYFNEMSASQVIRRAVKEFLIGEQLKDRAIKQFKADQEQMSK